MHSPALTMTSLESVANIARLVTETTHGAFPVIRRIPECGYDVAYGLITRLVLRLMRDQLYVPRGSRLQFSPSVDQFNRYVLKMVLRVTRQ